MFYSRPLYEAEHLKLRLQQIQPAIRLLSARFYLEINLAPAETFIPHRSRTRSKQYDIGSTAQKA